MKYRIGSKVAVCVIHEREAYSPRGNLSKHKAKKVLEKFLGGKALDIDLFQGEITEMISRKDNSKLYAIRVEKFIYPPKTKFDNEMLVHEIWLEMGEIAAKLLGNPSFRFPLLG